MKDSRLTQYELTKILPFIKKGLIDRHRAGFRKPISGKQIREMLASKANIHLDASRLRKIIHRMSIDGVAEKLVLCATTKGYFLTSNPLEINKYKKSLEDRIKSQMLRYSALERDCAKIENRKQLSVTDVFYKD